MVIVPLTTKFIALTELREHIYRFAFSTRNQYCALQPRQNLFNKYQQVFNPCRPSVFAYGNFNNIVTVQYEYDQLLLRKYIVTDVVKIKLIWTRL